MGGGLALVVEGTRVRLAAARGQRRSLPWTGQWQIDESFLQRTKCPLLGVRYFSRANFNSVERSFEPPAPALNKLRLERGGR